MRVCPYLCITIRQEGNSEKEVEGIALKIYRGMEQLVARRAHNPKVTGSSPVPATKQLVDRFTVNFLCFIGFLMQVVDSS